MSNGTNGVSPFTYSGASGGRPLSADRATPKSSCSARGGSRCRARVSYAHGCLDAAVKIVELGHHFGCRPDAVLLAPGDLLDEAGADQLVDRPVGGCGGTGCGFDLDGGHDGVVIERLDEGSCSGVRAWPKLCGPQLRHRLQPGDGRAGAFGCRAR